MSHLTPQDDQPSWEDVDLQTTRDIRNKYVSKLTADDSCIADPEKFMMLKELLNGMDRASLSSKKVRHDGRMADANLQAAAMIAVIMNRADARQIGEGPTGLPRDEPVLPELGYTPDIVEGELEVGTVSEDFRTFMDRQVKAGRVKPT
jgi:hypothetical protein